MKVTLEIDKVLQEALDEVGDTENLDSYEDIVDFILCDYLKLTSDEGGSEEEYVD